MKNPSTPSSTFPALSWSVLLSESPLFSKVFEFHNKDELGVNCPRRKKQTHTAFDQPRVFIAKPNSLSARGRSARSGKYFQTIQKSVKCSENILKNLVNQYHVCLPTESVYLPQLNNLKKTLVIDPIRVLLSNATPPLGAAQQRLRPFAEEFIARTNELFELVAFTTLDQQSADALLKTCGPLQTCFHHRLYRQHCTAINGFLVKDLRVFSTRALSNLVVVDTEASAFGFQPTNGVSIDPWQGTSDDTMLCDLLMFLEQLVPLKDVRERIREPFAN